MNENNENLQENEILVDQEELDIEELDHYLSGLEPGYTVLISRLEPGWCKGILEDHAIDEVSDPISINYLINTWGGYRLRLKFRRPSGQWLKHRDLNLFSFQPLLWGQPIRQPSVFANPHLMSNKSNGSDNSAPAPQAVVQPPTVSNAESTMNMMEMMKMLQAMRASDIQAMAAMMQAQQQQQPSAPDPYKMLTGALGVFSQIQQTLRPSPPKDDNDEVLSLLGKFADMFSKKGELEPARLTPPTESTALHEQLAGLEPTAAIGTLQRAVSVMPADKQTETVAALIGSIENIGGTDVLLSELEKRGILKYDDGDVDTEDESGSDSGGEP